MLCRCAPPADVERENFSRVIFSRSLLDRQAYKKAVEIKQIYSVFSELAIVSDNRNETNPQKNDGEETIKRETPYTWSFYESSDTFLVRFFS